MEVQEGEGNVKYLSKQYPIVGIQMGVSVFYSDRSWRAVGSAWADDVNGIEVCTSKPGVHNLFNKASWYWEWSQLVSI